MKKGFTLIELLAVIIILAVISTIVAPVVLDIINDSKKSTYESSIELYGKALKQAILNYELDKKTTPTTFNQIKPYLEFEGNNVECDTKIIYEDGEIYLKNCSVDDNPVEGYTYGKATLTDTILKHATENNYFYTKKPNFNNVTKDGEYGLYMAEDDLGDSYYFRGDVENNYVQFGVWGEIVSKKYYGVDYFIAGGHDTYEECIKRHTEDGAPWTECVADISANKEDPMYWRIVRVNGDGTIRLVYDGIDAVDNQTKHHTNVHISEYDSAMNVKYSYLSNGIQKDSTIKSVIDSWYNTHLKTDYEKYISDSIFCNDVSSGTQEYLFIYDQESYESGMGGYTNYTGYPAVGRIHALVKEKMPTFKCANKEDRFTVNDTENGNGLLSNPVALLTGDEVTFAGAPHGGGTAAVTYLYQGYGTDFTMTPVSESSVYYFSNSIELSDYVNVSRFVRPVINLKADVRFTGTGTIDDPYVIMTD